MEIQIFKTRKNKLRKDLEFILQRIEPTETELDFLMIAFDEYQKANLDTIGKLKRERHLETKRISGALKQTLNAHGPITKQFIGSATKRIHGALLSNMKQENLITRLFKKLWRK
jgi:hypothetical protein